VAVVMPFLLGTGPVMHYKSLLKHTVIKTKVNRCVLSLRLNKYKLSTSRTVDGRLFHTAKPRHQCGIGLNEYFFYYIPYIWLSCRFLHCLQGDAFNYVFYYYTTHIIIIIIIETDRLIWLT